MLFESRTASRACVHHHLPAPVEEVKEPDNAVNIARLNSPAAIEPLNVTRRCGPVRPNVEERTPGRHNPINLAGDDGSESLGDLRNQAEMPFCQTVAQLGAGAVRPKLHIFDESLLAMEFKLRTSRTSACKDKAKVRMVREAVNDSCHGCNLMSKSEVAGVVHCQRPIRKREWRNFHTVSPVLCNVNLVLSNTASHEAGFHVVAKRDDGIRPSPGPVQNRAAESLGNSTFLEIANVACNVRVNIHLPDHMSGMPNSCKHPTENV